MDILYLLVPISVALVLVIIALFGWAIYSGQLDHLEGEGERILQDDD
ncbi:MAG: cbb3-type cytochrome oxidase assembly protein CcoS [Burkholderiaceae bacterium]|jgi:cbb3-type cytochrome oxidase maturation protein|nr:cbb3-type cytochrome oxidase assembly protein CcoS [Burkholderiaceae bacterium]